ncbi:ABC transporter ATP-binding protein [Adlercreutzia sp. ZJ141]|uniref:ABC transporter ATP-binding protein n=1 Tax=Adlercreutzia sp. ZJ141 TaxID=2709406 RepID=UPI0013EBC9CE|nr:ABC transporter ATP-binding protein [Adlercreutzia sp. ZJ141]
MSDKQNANTCDGQQREQSEQHKQNQQGGQSGQSGQDQQREQGGKQARPSVTRRTLHYYWVATKNHLGLFVALVLSTLGFGGFQTYGNPFVMGLIVDRVSSSPVPPDQVFQVFGPYIAALVLINVCGQTCSKLQDYTLWKLEIAVNYDLATMAFDALSNQSMSFHTNRFGGTLVSQTSKFMSAYNQLVEAMVHPFLPVTGSIIYVCVLLGPRVPVYVCVLLVLLSVYASVSYIMYKRILHLNEKAATAQNNLSGELSDAVTNILSVKTYGREDYERALFDAANKEVVARDSKRMRSSLARGIITACLAVVIMSVVTVFISGGNAWFGITAGTLVMMFTYTYTITIQFNFINSGLQRFNRAFGDASGMTVVLDEPRLVADVDDATPLVVREGSIDFERIGFSYDDGGVQTSVFHDFDLHIPAGQRVGLVGMSGAGKTTLTKLLLRLVDIQEGRILVDGQDVARVTQQSLRRNIAYVPQESLLFHRSIAENIAYGRPDATIDQIREAARQANALEFIEKLPQGFDTITGERGIKLSGGQRQRIVIARAMLADCPILVLDEATSALDSESEALVQDALARLMSGRTAIVVAHRLSTVANLDRIVVLGDGGVVEDGTHDQLVEAGGTYAHLWGRQSGAFFGE